jgi:colicin import membrane protein
VKRDADIALERASRSASSRNRSRPNWSASARQRRKQLEAEKKREDEIARKKLEQQSSRMPAQGRRKAQGRRQEAQAAGTGHPPRQAARAMRDENVKRSIAMAGTGAPGSTGTAAQSSGPSASWGAKVQARVRPNIVFSDDVAGNPKAEVEVRSAPDGTIVGKKLVRSSGVKAWDDAVLRALDKTEVLPRDTDGRVPSPVGDRVQAQGLTANRRHPAALVAAHAANLARPEVRRALTHRSQRRERVVHMLLIS